MNLNAPEIKPLAAWCISALMAGMEISYLDVPSALACDEPVFEAVMDEICYQFHHGQPSTVH